MEARDTTVRLAEPATEATARLSSEGEGPLVLGRYRLIARLGAGGFGAVWRARDERLEREVAIKVVPRGTDPSEDERVRREARTAARLGHPGIVALYELAADEHHLYLVSELVRGRTLAELIEARAVADRDVARIGAALCDALEHAHGRGVIHRDVKPGNVMVVADPAAGSGFAKLTDFGIAHASGDPPTSSGDPAGTLAYMAPEHLEGHGATPGEDVYSLALTLYEAWTGANPLRARGAAGPGRRVGRRPPPLRRRRGDLPPSLCEAIDAALDPAPARRPPLGALRRELQAAGPLLSDEGGLVEPKTLARVGLPRRGRRSFGLRLRGARVVRVEAARTPALIAQRLAAGLGAGGLVLAALEWLGPPPPFSPLAAAAATAAAVALLPRVGWLVAALGVCGWLASPEAGREGTALVLVAALLPIPLLVPRAGTSWSLPALAPLLGLAGLAPAFVGVAGLAGTAWRRAGLAAAGFVSIAAAEVLSGDQLLFGAPDGTLPRADWQGSVGAAAAHGLGPALTSPALAPVLVWAGFAAVLPLAVRGRLLVLDVAGAAAWTAGLAVAHRALGGLLASTTPLDSARGSLTGAIVAAVVAVCAAALWRSTAGASPEPAGAV
jgi:eukaryotic-like serine/threonine-protein kinase